MEGIKIYNGPGTMPVPFNRPGSICGVIGVWTDEGGLSVTPLELPT